jgi:pyruvate/2-oxoacid:ferredoxin oxidoreductase beta subunit
VPSPCISGWKFDDGHTVELALLGARTGVFPAFIWEKGKGGQIKDCELDPAARPPLEEFLGMQRRFHHLLERDRETGRYRARAGQEATLDRLRDWVQKNVERLHGLAALK